MEPLRTAWTAAGEPPATHANTAGPCARCLTVEPLTPTGRVVSENFTAYDTWAQPNGPGLCAACAWAYSTPALRNTPHRVDREPMKLQPLDKPALFEILNHGALSLDTALVVPLRAARKHVLPLAKWGRAQMDDLTLSWASGDATRLTHVKALRAAGAPASSFNDPAPPHHVLGPTGPLPVRDVLDLWEQLAPWRSAPPWMRLALYATS